MLTVVNAPDGSNQSNDDHRSILDEIVREDGVTLEQIAADFGIHPMTLNKWIRKADVEAGIKPGTTSAESRELREAKRRVRLLEQENEVLRRAAAYLSQANLPGKGGTRS
ncbi:transposase [Gordonia desulfuricans]|uniref:transposase n=1 Tax=Gordonia desulfuricans TaxID=89051 RepID=UPI00192E79F5